METAAVYSVELAAGMPGGDREAEGRMRRRFRSGIGTMCRKVSQAMGREPNLFPRLRLLGRDDSVFRVEEVLQVFGERCCQFLPGEKFETPGEARCSGLRKGLEYQISMRSLAASSRRGRRRTRPRRRRPGRCGSVGGPGFGAGVSARAALRGSRSTSKTVSRSR